MKIFETLDRDPRATALANTGQARLTQSRDERATEELRAELESFVCEGQYGDAIERILRSFLTQMDKSRQRAAWVSGFFGSGKSHLLKMLGHLWVDTVFPDGTTARTLVRGLPDEVVALFRELDTRAARTGRTKVAAAGTLPSGSGEMVKLTVLAVVLEACGLPAQYPQAQFCFWLRRQGYLEPVKEAVEKGGREWLRELNDLYVSGRIARALLDCDPAFAKDERDARQVLRARFPVRTTDISTAELIAAIREALAPEGELPLTALVLDEAQQYIGDSTDRAVAITEVAEAIYTGLDNRVLLVMSGQSALSGTPLLMKLRDRFQITVQLSDTDVETVTRKVLLHKRATAVEAIRSRLAESAGEISRHLTGTRLAERPSDRQIAVADYPLLPTRRRFWEECFRVVDAAGTRSQLRSQLRILYDALRAICEAPVGAVIPADALFDAIQVDLVNTGVLLNELASRIQSLADGTEAGVMRRRICGLVFLINKLPRGAGVDAGLRANARTLADLMITDLSADSGAFRKAIDLELDGLVAAGTLMRVGDEVRLQTAQGAEWDRAFREKVATLGGQLPELQAKQDQLFATAVQDVVGGIRIRHGEAKIKREIVIHAREDAPPADGSQIVLWLRDGSSTAQKDVESEARRRGHEDPVIHAFIRKPGSDLKTSLVEAEAARLVLDMYGSPAEPAEAREACESMKSRYKVAADARDAAVRDLVGSARIYQGGGSEVFADGLAAKLEMAADASLARLFPRFADGDHRAWESAGKRAREGADEPFKVVGWERATDDHPVVREVLTVVGNGTRGADVRKALEGRPFGWPKDAIDAAVFALHRAGTLRAVHNGQTVPPGALTQDRLSTAELKPERVRLSTKDKIDLRGLYQKAGISVKSGEEESKAPLFLDALLELARGAGGDAPLPPRPSTSGIEELKRQSGTEQLGAILAAREELLASIDEWERSRQRASDRLERWKTLCRLLEHADGVPSLDDVRTDAAAIRTQRTLLEETDFVQPLVRKVEKTLRAAVKEAHVRCVTAVDREQVEFEATDVWRRLSEAQRAEIVRSNRLERPAEPDVSSPAALIEALDRRSLSGWSELAESIPTRFARARQDAVRLFEPRTQTVTLRSDTLRSADDVRAWLARTEADLIERLNSGPIVIG